ncbi:A/G-specific DNA-adenine glycosylase [Amphibacillus marinus]|uniref:Adenine DNA glycosylase n=1 Tax=Amphibacillus marinus TaxID=872970 RepID=A0A1H8RL42_9BACI|nr:A/G-specific adenine glycosylase [Amphibacillus marinus]SEO66683.1 A/G-specific DNA-adenine glycosylase [Amphibacillus marinus]
MKNLSTKEYLDTFNKGAFQVSLINWFKSSQRTLPWRADKDPYKIWVSEIMLQQTQVDTVIPYFNNFIEQFPTPIALAEAEEQDVLKAWEGLGYYSRARNLQAAVREVKESYHGKVPEDKDQLSALKGIGPYTLGAIMSIAFEQAEPAVDGNVMRVLARILNINEDIAKPRTRKLFELIVREIIASHDPSSFNQGLMELGALVCRPKNPKCDHCPVQEYCQANTLAIQGMLPVKTKAKKQKKLSYYTFVIENNKGELLVEKRPDNGLLASLWQFPMIETKGVDMNMIPAFIEATFHTNVLTIKQLAPVRHVFSHLIWQMDVYAIKVDQLPQIAANQLMLISNQLSDYPFPVPHQRIINMLV